MRAAFLALILLAGCGDGAPEPAPSLTSDAATGEVRGRIAPKGAEAVTLRSGAAVPVILPPGLTLYPGATVVANTVVERDGARRVLVVFETPDPLAKVMMFHRGQAEAAGAVLTLDLGGKERASIAGRLPSGGDLTVTARRTGAATRIELGAS